MKNYNTLLNRYGVNTPLRLAHFFAQIEHESGLKPIKENLNYSARQLLKVFPRYFTAETAKVFQYKPELIANIVYGGRMGNGKNNGDGWKYRGRGLMQITGYNQYKMLSDFTGIDYVNNPDLLLNEADAMISALWYWKMGNLNRYADIDNLDAISDIINIGKRTDRHGDANGFGHRSELLTKWKKHYKVETRN